MSAIKLYKFNFRFSQEKNKNVCFFVCVCVCVHYFLVFKLLTKYKVILKGKSRGKQKQFLKFLKK
jgi:hypothetical protein